MREQLERARDDASVRALLLRINSPGGTVTASDILYQELMRFKRDRGVPVVAHFLGVAASGAYYVAMAADEVVAQPTTVTGSIGVIFVGVNLSGLMQKIGVADQTLTAGAQKDAGSWLRPMQPAERAHLQAVLDDMHDRFKKIVVAGRPRLDAQRVDALADGRIYSADQALANGLVDGLGDLEQAVAATQRRAGLASARVVIYHRPREYRQNLYTQAPAIPQVAAARAGAFPAAGAAGLSLPVGAGPALTRAASHRARAAGRARREPLSGPPSRPSRSARARFASVGPASVLVAEDLGHRHAGRHRAVRRPGARARVHQLRVTQEADEGRARVSRRAQLHRVVVAVAAVAELGATPTRADGRLVAILRLQALHVRHPGLRELMELILGARSAGVRDRGR